jgi:alpha-L-rhamnosidase
MTRQTTSVDQSSTVTIVSVRFEHAQETLGLGTARPRLSWISETTSTGWRQTGYEIEASYVDGQRQEQTGRIESDQSVLLSWSFAPLASRERRLVRVRVWGNDGQLSAWSEPASVEVGLLEPADWSAHFITPDKEGERDTSQALPLLRREFDVRGGVAQARLYITSLGSYEAEINGKRVGDHVLVPGWTSYQHRLRYQTFDVTNLLQEGRNAIGVLLGDGWYRSKLRSGGTLRTIYGTRLALLAQLEITYADGSQERVVTDEQWQTAPGPILASDLYQGETYDARLERTGWSEPGYASQNWSGVSLLERDLTTLVAPSGPPVRRIEEIAPIEIKTSPSGRTIVDFGQNLTGRLRLTVRGEAGQTITLRHAEILHEGELDTRSLLEAQARDRYILRGGSEETWEPRFTFHGFRYAEIGGWPGTLRAEDLRAVVCHSDLERVGWFACSDPLLNRLHENVVWSMRDNFLDIPSDCPQRSERFGWTGDIQVFAPTATFLYDTAGFLTSWLADLAADQQALGGQVPTVIPTIHSPFSFPAAGWGDAAVIVPWVLYQRYGDLGILETQFASMCAWVDYVDRTVGASHLWDASFQFGDWLDPAAPPDQAWASRTDSGLVATAYFARSADLLGQIAAVFGRQEEALRYRGLAEQVRTAFAHEYLSPSGRAVSDTETAYALVLQFGLCSDPEQRQHAGQRLAALVRQADYHISTGFLGTPLICDALCQVGHEALAYSLLTQRTCPSWLFPVTMGATTIWEHWDALRPDGTPNPEDNVPSFNHYAFGAVADWMHRVVAGLAPAAPGYRRLRICPQPGGGLTSAHARHRTPYGLAEVSWRIAEEQLTVEAVVPPNTTALVHLPGQEAREVGSGQYSWTYSFSTAITLDSPVRTFLDDRRTWHALLQALPFPGDAENLAHSLRTQLQAHDELPARVALADLLRAGNVQAALKSALATLSAVYEP